MALFSFHRRQHDYESGQARLSTSPSRTYSSKGARWIICVSLADGVPRAGRFMICKYSLGTQAAGTLDSDADAKLAAPCSLSMAPSRGPLSVRRGRRDRISSRTMKAEVDGAGGRATINTLRLSAPSSEAFARLHPAYSFGAAIRTRFLRSTTTSRPRPTDHRGRRMGTSSGPRGDEYTVTRH
jgi:hypothetical protein